MWEGWGRVYQREYGRNRETKNHRLGGDASTEKELLMMNTIFYTFSTIAQTLAGAIALLGADAMEIPVASLSRTDTESDRS